MNIGGERMHVLGIALLWPGGGEEGGLEHVHHTDQHGHKKQADEGDDDGEEVKMVDGGPLSGLRDIAHF